MAGFYKPVVFVQNGTLLKHAFQESSPPLPLDIQALATATNLLSVTDLLTSAGFPETEMYSPTDDASEILNTNWNSFPLVNRATASNANVQQPTDLMVMLHLQDNFLSNSLRINYLYAIGKRLQAFGSLYTVYVGSQVWRNCGQTNFNIVDGNSYNTQSLQLKYQQLIFDNTNPLQGIAPTNQINALNSGAKQ